MLNTYPAGKGHSDRKRGTALHRRGTVGFLCEERGVNTAVTAATAVIAVMDTQ